MLNRKDLMISITETMNRELRFPIHYHSLLSKITCILVISVHALFAFPLKAQSIFLSTSNEPIYSFINEMELEGKIDINDVIKPFSRLMIANKLLEIKQHSESLNHRQKKELDYFLHDFLLDYDSSSRIDHILIKPLEKLNPLKQQRTPLNLFAYRDNENQVVVNPSIGINLWTNKNGSFYHSWSGVSMYSTFRNKWGLYLQYNDNRESQELERQSFLTERSGVNYRSEGHEYLKVNAGFNYTWSWGSLGLQFDNFSWGSGYHGTNILSGKTPSFAYLRLNIKPLRWFELNYIHGWLQSMIIDSSRSYTFPTSLHYSRRDVYRPKFIAANLVTLSPFKSLSISFGNSVIYSDYNIQPAFLIPVMIFRFADTQIETTSNNTGNNSQIFFDISYIPVRKINLYSSLFIDEFSFRRMWDPARQSNYLSWKCGIKMVNIMNSNLAFIGEYTRTNPEVYKHVIPSLTYETNRFTLGHYLKDNSQEVYLALEYKPISKFNVLLSFTLVKKGPDYELLPNASRWGLTFLEPVIFESSIVETKINYLIKNNVSVWLDYQFQSNSGDMSFVPEVFHGITNTFNSGLAWGF